MYCPRCEEEMEFYNEGDMNNWFKGVFVCEHCEFEASGDRTPQDYDYVNGVYKGFDNEDTFDKENGGYISDEEALDMHNEAKFQQMRDGEL